MTANLALCKGYTTVRRNLVIVRAGDQSLHLGWLKPERNWDIIVNYYGDDPAIYRQDDVVRIDSKGPKWPALHDLIANLQDQIAGYDFVWFPDDDLACVPDDIDPFFMICRDHELEIAQPALTHDSHIGVSITVANHAFFLRYTNFIEIMAPCFSQPFLKKCWPTFATSLSGWGLDFVWPRQASDPCKAAVIDAIQVKHTRPHGGPNYNALKERGVDPHLEFADLLAKEQIKLVHIITGGIDLQGRRLLLKNKAERQELFRKVLVGYLPEYAHHPDILFTILQPMLDCFGR